MPAKAEAERLLDRFRRRTEPRPRSSSRGAGRGSGRRRPESRSILIALVAGTLAQLGAAECMRAVPASAHRPFVTEDAGTLEPGHIELEVGHETIWNRGRPPTQEGIYTVNIGLLSRTEADLTGKVVYHLEDEGVVARGFGDLDLVLKHRLRDESAHWPAVAAVASVLFPTADASRGLGGGKAAYSILGVLTKGFGPVTAHANAGWRFDGAGPDHLFASAALSFELTPKWHLLAEWDGAYAPGTEADASGLLTGLILSPSERLAIDAAVRFGTEPGDDDYRAIFGFTLGF